MLIPSFFIFLPSTPFKMKPFFLLLLLLLLPICFIIPSPASSVFAAGSSYQNCSRELIRCGSEHTNIGYPFWGMNRPDYCGYPGFHLNCTDDSQLELTIMSQTYRVVTTDDDTQTVTVARADYTENLCPSLLLNNTLNTTIFQQIPDETANITLYYDCSPLTFNSNSYFNSFTCSNINGSNDLLLNYYTTLNRGNLGQFLAAVSRCQDTVALQAERTLVENLGNSISFDTDNLVRTLGGGFPLRWSADNSLCEDCRDSGGECGRNVSSGGFRCFCRDGDGVNVNNTTTCPSGDNKSGSIVRKKVYLGVSAGVLGVVITVIIMIMRNNPSVTTCISQENVMNNHNVEALIVNHGSLAPKRYNYSDIKKMTRSFQYRVGKGGYGTVYRGNLSNGRVVAVKVLSETKGNGEEFINEVASIARTSHVNIVSLVGFCYQGKKRALVYEFMPNGSLDRFISAKGVASNRLGWGTMYETSIGIARGLEYLHRGCNTRILHFDIKPQNILLDKDFCPKISDFGLAKLCKRGESIISMTGARGTIGYIAPEVFYRGYGGVSHKSDVYSYGMLVLEMVGGRAKTDETAPSDASEAYFPDWIYKDLERGNVGVPHEDITEEEEEKVRKMILVSLWCIQIIPSDRPSMSKVVEMLEGSVHSLQVPPKPLLFSPAMQALDSSTVQELSQYQTA